MAKNPTKAIITFIATAVLVWTVALRRKSPGSKYDTIDEGDSFEFPKVRAHVYFATMEEAVSAVKTAASLNASVAITEGNSLALTMPIDEARMITLKVDCQSLGPRHIRVVIRPSTDDNPADSAKIYKLINEIQSDMDELLIGG